MNEKKLIYLDNAATTKVNRRWWRLCSPYLTRYYGNPSSVYEFSDEPKKALAHSREVIAAALGAKPNEIYFTGCGTESDNWALKTTAEAYAGKGNHIITSKIEHHAILHTCEWLEKHGVEVTYLDVDENGRISADDLESHPARRRSSFPSCLPTMRSGIIEPIKEMERSPKAQDFCSTPTRCRRSAMSRSMWMSATLTCSAPADTRSQRPQGRRVSLYPHRREDPLLHPRRAGENAGAARRMWLRSRAWERL